MLADMKQQTFALNVSVERHSFICLVVPDCYVPEPFYSFFFILPYVNLFSATHGDSQA